MTTKLLRYAAAIATLVASAHALSIPEGQGVAFSVDAFAPTEPEQFEPAVEWQRLQAKFPTSLWNEPKEIRSEKLAGSAKTKVSASGLAFYVPTVVGNQTFQFIYDTGSADLWVYSNESSPYQSLDHLTYVPTSSAELLPNYTWAIKYAGGQEVSGVVFTDTVIAGSVVAHKQAVQAALIIPFEFGSDGIMGLAFSSINTVTPDKQKTFFETVMPTLKKKLFAANLRTDGKPSTWDFGYIDTSKFTGKLIYAPVTSTNHWQMKVGSYSVGKGSFTDSTKQVGDVIVDSGTSLVYLPQAVVDDYYSQIKGYKYLEIGDVHSYPCNTTVPDFHFKVEGATLSIPGRNVNYTTYDPDKGICAGGINSQLNMKYSVLGNMFMKNYYVVHSQEEATPRLGFAGH